MNCKGLAAIFSVSLFCLGAYVQCADDDPGSFATSVDAMAELLGSEAILIKALSTYAELMEEKLKVIHSALRGMREENDRAREDPEAYLGNPINAFSFVRRMHADWVQWEYLLTDLKLRDQINIIKDQNKKLPSKDDLEGALVGISRLQQTYDLKVTEMSVGFINGKKYNATFNSIDCYTIGKELYYQGKVKQASYWLYAAHLLHKDTEVTKMMEVDQEKILLHYAQVLIMSNKGKDALTTLEALITMYPNNEELIKKKAELEKMTEKPLEIYAFLETLNAPDPVEPGCRGEYDKRPSRLHCHYNHTTNAFLKLAPLKLEEISLDPYVVLYHDVISDAEIKEMKMLSRGKLQRATVFGPNERSQVDNKRTSKFAWFDDNANEVTEHLNRRISDMTGFDMAEAEQLQMMNYGLGGHYEAHHDYFDVKEDADVVRMRGNRIATVMFYLSDVDQGGATVFPAIKRTVYPRKGTALLWYNLDNKVKGDPRTLHVACPVLVGSKWVCNKWIRSKNQMFRKPCHRQ